MPIARRPHISDVVAGVQSFGMITRHTQATMSLRCTKHTSDAVAEVQARSVFPEHTPNGSNATNNKTTGTPYLHTEAQRWPPLCNGIIPPETAVAWVCTLCTTFCLMTALGAPQNQRARCLRNHLRFRSNDSFPPQVHFLLQ